MGGGSSFLRSFDESFEARGKSLNVLFFNDVNRCIADGPEYRSRETPKALLRLCGYSRPYNRFAVSKVCSTWNRTPIVLSWLSSLCFVDIRTYRR